MKDIPKIVTWTIGPYFMLLMLFLSILAIITWLASDFKSFIKFIPFIPELSLSEGKFVLFKQAIIAACCSGLGGTVFMSKRFYFNYIDGVERKHKAQDRTLGAIDIPQFIFLPISSIIIGPISLCLLKAGSIAFEGFSGKGQVPIFTVIALSFIMGLSYYDTLHAFCEMSKRRFWKDKNSLGEGKKMKPLSEELIQLNMDIYDAVNKSLEGDENVWEKIHSDVFADNCTVSYLQNTGQGSKGFIS